MAKLENRYQEDLIDRLETIFPECLIMKSDANYRQGIPDIAIYDGPFYAILEVKKDSEAKHQPNQDWYINHFLTMGAYAAFIFPENEDQILDEVTSYFTRMEARL